MVNCSYLILTFCASGFSIVIILVIVSLTTDYNS